jgi:hypothetical protein
MLVQIEARKDNVRGSIGCMQHLQEFLVLFRVLQGHRWAFAHVGHASFAVIINFMRKDCAYKVYKYHHGYFKSP